jgi:hypothetical protein
MHSSHNLTQPHSASCTLEITIVHFCTQIEKNILSYFPLYIYIWNAENKANSNFKYQDYYSIIDRSQTFNASWTLQTILIQREILDSS